MKKIITLILCVAMLISVMGTTAAAKTEYVPEEPLRLIHKLGIMDAFSANVADLSAVTRGELAAVIAKLVNIEWAADGAQIFSDVSVTHTYYNQIALAKELGIMIGDESGAFRPGQAVTYEQAAKCMVYLLGYTMQAERLGGYPTGYVLQASRLGCFDNIKYTNGGEISRAELALMIYNSLDINLVDIVTIGEDITYSNTEEDTILSKYLGIRKFEAVLNAVDGRSILTREEVCSEGYVKIGSTVAKYTDTQIPQYLGQTVEAYVTDESYGTTELVYAFPTDKNTELVIPISDLETEHSDFSLTRFYYVDASGRTKDVKLNEEHRFLYNGKYDYDFDVDDLNFDTGYVTLINNDSDQEYDVCMVWSYENFVIESVNGENVKCYYNKALKYDEDKTYRVLTVNGEWGGWEQLDGLSAWDVLSIAHSKDLSLVTIQASRGGIAGTVEGISSEDGKTEVTIGGREYIVSNQYFNNAPNSGTVEIKAGLKSEFYFDIIGEIAAVYRTDSVNDVYGYIIGAEKDSDFSSEYKVKIFTEKGDVVLYKTDGKVKFTSENVDSKAIKAGEVFGEFLENGKFVPQVILYSADEKGVIKSIKKSFDATALGYDTDHFSKDFYIGEIPGSTQIEHLRYQDATSTFGMGASYEKRFNINSSTIIMYVPTSGGKTLEDDMVIADMAMFTSGTLYENITVYDCDDTYNAKLLLYTPEASSEGGSVKEEYFVAVEKAYVGLNEDGDYEPMVRTMYRGAEKVFPYISEDGYIPEDGSILRCEKKLTGELIVKKSNVVYSPSETKELYDMKSFAENGSTYLPLVWSQHGRIWRKNGSAFTVYTGAEVPRANYLNAGYIIYKISEDNEISTASEADLLTSTENPDGSLVVINNRYQYVREMWIIEE